MSMNIHNELIELQRAPAVLTHHEERCVKTHGSAHLLPCCFLVDCHHRVERERNNLNCWFTLKIGNQSRNKVIFKKRRDRNVPVFGHVTLRANAQWRCKWWFIPSNGFLMSVSPNDISNECTGTFWLKNTLKRAHTQRMKHRGLPTEIFWALGVWHRSIDNKRSPHLEHKQCRIHWCAHIY